MPDFATLLKRHRLAVGISQDELSERASLSREAVNALERGVRRAPYRETVVLLADALGIHGAAREEFETVARAARRRRLKSEAHEPSSNLKHSDTSFVGRDVELREVEALLERHGCVTITGPGGIGKTRLSLEVAARDEWRERETWFVDLSQVDERKTVAEHVAATLQLKVSSVEDSLSAIGFACERRKMLLILDNCEFVVEHVAALVSALRARGQLPSTLVTSRQRLGISGEVVYALTSLALPPDPVRTAAEALRFAAVELLVERAKAVDQRFAITEDSVEAVIDICRRVDGIPLAIELAAARIPLIGILPLRNRLVTHLDALAEGRPDRPTRQRTLRATIEWSHDLLTDSERTLFRRLAVFPASWSLEAAEHVCSGDRLEQDAIYDLVSSLVEKSMVRLESSDNEPRYRFFESTRAFARDMLAKSGESEACARAHAQWIVEHGALGSERQLDDARAALTWALGPGDDPALAGKIVGAAWPAWVQAGRHRELQGWAETIVPLLDENTRSAVIGRVYRGLLPCLFGRELLELERRAMPVFEQSGDRANQFHTTMAVMNTHILANRFEEAERKSQAGAALIGDPADRTLHTLMTAWLRCNQGRTSEAKELLASAFLSTQGTATGRWALHARNTLALAEFIEGNVDEAIRIAEDTLADRTICAPDGRPAFHLICSLATYNLKAGRDENARATAKMAVELVVSQPAYAVFRVSHPVAAILARAGGAVQAARFLGYADAWARREEISTGIAPDRYCFGIAEEIIGASLQPEQRNRLALGGAALPEAAILSEMRSAL